jgi:hypothetical protein
MAWGRQEEEAWRRKDGRGSDGQGDSNPTQDHLYFLTSSSSESETLSSRKAIHSKDIRGSKLHTTGETPNPSAISFAMSSSLELNQNPNYLSWGLTIMWGNGSKEGYNEWFERNYDKIAGRVSTKGVLDIQTYYYLILEESGVLIRFKTLFTWVGRRIDLRQEIWELGVMRQCGYDLRGNNSSSSSIDIFLP